MKIKKFLAILLAATMAVGMTACGNGGGDSSSESSSEPSSQSQSDTGDDAIAEAQKVLKIEGENTEIKSTGPNGETATPATSLSLTDDEIKKIREGGYKAGISFHYGGNDWSASQLQGLTDAFKACLLYTSPEFAELMLPSREASTKEASATRIPETIKAMILTVRMLMPESFVAFSLLPTA